MRAVGGRDPGVEVGGVVGQHAAAGQATGLEGLQQGELGALELVLAGRAQRVAHVDGVEMVPEGLGGELAGGVAPQVGEDAVAVPVGNRGLRAGGADAVEGGEQEEMGDGGALGGGGPDGEEGVESAGEAGGCQRAAGRPQSRAVASRGKGAALSRTSWARRSAVPR